MFAVSIEYNGNTVGNQLSAINSTNNGLASMPFDQSAVWQRGGITLVQQTQWNTAYDKFNGKISSHSEAGIRVAGWVRLYNIEELKGKLGTCNSQNTTQYDYVVKAYLKWGDSLCDHLVGDFAFVIYDPRNDVFLAVRDHIGIRPLYYYQDKHRIIFASSIGIISELKGLSLSPSEKWIALNIIGNSSDATATAYREIKKIPPAHTASCKGTKTVSRGDIDLELYRYFDFDPDKQIRLGSGQEYVEAYRELLGQAVASRVESDYGIASESSGGLDSSSIISIAAQKMRSPETDLSCFGFADTALEAQRIMEVSAYSRVGSTQLFSSEVSFSPEHFSESYDRILLHKGVPNEYSAEVGAFHLYKAAQKNGARTLLSGFGGDQFVTNYAHLVKTELLDQSNVRLWLSRLGGNYGVRYKRGLFVFN